MEKWNCIHQYFCDSAKPTWPSDVLKQIKDHRIKSKSRSNNRSLSQSSLRWILQILLPLQSHKCTISHKIHWTINFSTMIHNIMPLNMVPTQSSTPSWLVILQDNSVSFPAWNFSSLPQHYLPSTPKCNFSFLSPHSSLLILLLSISFMLHFN